VSVSLFAENIVRLTGRVGATVAVTVSAGWATVTNLTEVGGTGAPFQIPYTAVPTNQRTNMYSGFVDWANQPYATNVFNATNAAWANVVNVSNAQTIVGAKTFSGGGSASNMSVLVAPAISGVIVALTNGTLQGTLLSNVTLSASSGYASNVFVNKSTISNATLHASSGYVSNIIGHTVTITNLSVPGSGAYSINIGNGSSATADYATAIGDNALASGSANVAIGQGALASGSANVAIGQGSLAGTNAYNIAIGYDADTYYLPLNRYAENSILIGASSDNAGTNSIVIGSASRNVFTNVVAIGQGIFSQADNEFILGTDQHQLLVQGVFTNRDTGRFWTFATNTLNTFAVLQDITNHVGASNTIYSYTNGLATTAYGDAHSLALTNSRVARLSGVATNLTLFGSNRLSGVLAYDITAHTTLSAGVNMAIDVGTNPIVRFSGFAGIVTNAGMAKGWIGRELIVINDGAYDMWWACNSSGLESTADNRLTRLINAFFVQHPNSFTRWFYDGSVNRWRLIESPNSISAPFAIGTNAATATALMVRNSSGTFAISGVDDSASNVGVHGQSDTYQGYLGDGDGNAAGTFTDGTSTVKVAGSNGLLELGAITFHIGATSAPTFAAQNGSVYLSTLGEMWMKATNWVRMETK
jgi:hypothetical protein